MGKILILNVCFFAASVFAAGIAFGQARPATPAQNVLIHSPTTGDTNAAVNDKFAELLTKYSSGRLMASVRHGGSLGSFAQVLPALQAGSVHGTVMPAGFMAAVVPELSLFDMPFLLPGAPAEITAFAAQSQVAAKMIESAGQKAIHIVGFHGIGAQSFLTRFPVSRLGDIEGKRFRVIPSPPRMGAYQDWGAVARPMEFGEVYTSLQQGNLDGLENPPDVIFKTKLHEVAKYYTITEHNAFVSAIVVSKRWFDGLPGDLRDAVTKAGKDTIGFGDAAFGNAQNTSLEALRKAITVVDMPAAEIQKMRDLVRKGVWERLKNDPQRGALVRLLEEDAARFARK